MESSSGAPTPPIEEHPKSPGSRKSTSGSKVVKPVHRVSKRAHVHHTPSHDQAPHTPVDGKHKRVWKACERCRMKKTKCDGEFPCKRCKDDGLICTAGTRKKMEYKQLPPGYAEVLENAQFALVATVHKLYAMVRSSQQWELGEPALNDRGQPVVHDIAAKLGCLRPNHDLDPPLQSMFPEDDAGLAELTSRLEAAEREREQEAQVKAVAIKADGDDSPPCNATDTASSPELDHSDSEHDYRRAAAFTDGTLSPQSPIYEFDAAPSAAAPRSELDDATAAAVAAATVLFPGAQPNLASFPSWGASMEITPMMLHSSPQSLVGMNLLGQGLLGSDLGALKQHVVPNQEVMMGISDPMIYGGYDGEV